MDAQIFITSSISLRLTWNFDTIFLRYYTFVWKKIKNRCSEVVHWHKNFGWFFDFQKRCAKDRLLRWLCDKWPRLVQTKYQIYQINTKFNFWKQKFVEYVTITLAIDHNSGSFFIFEEKWPDDATVPKSAPNSHSLWVLWLLIDDVWILWAPNAIILLIDIASDVEMAFIWKDEIGLLEWGTVRPAMAVIWIMLCSILEWKGSIFLITPYFWRNIHKFFFIADSNSKC